MSRRVIIGKSKGSRVIKLIYLGGVMSNYFAVIDKETKTKYKIKLM